MSTPTGLLDRITGGIEKNAKPLGSVYGILGAEQAVATKEGTELFTILKGHIADPIMAGHIHPPDVKELLGKYLLGDYPTAQVFKSELMTALGAWIVGKLDIHPISNRLAGFLVNFMTAGAVTTALLATWLSSVHSNGDGAQAYPLGINKAAVWGKAESVFGSA